MLLPMRTADFDATLKLAGLPVLGVSGSGPDCRIDLAEGATDEQHAQARAMAQAFDWRERTAEERAVEASRAALASASPPERAVRETARALYESIVEVRQELNRRAAGEAPRLLAVRSWDDAVALVRARLGRKE